MKKSLVILTGGKSRRMGCDKSLLPFGSESVIEYIIRRFQPHFDSIILSVDKAGKYAQLGLHIDEAVDLIDGIGPIGALYTVFERTDIENAFLLAVDMPFADPSAASAVMEAAEGLDFCVIQNGNRAEPLFGFYSRSCLEAVRQCISTGQYRMKALLERCRGRYIDGGPFADSFFNMNDRSAYYKALHRLMNPPAPAISFVAWSGTGKTTFIEQLLPVLTKKGIKAAYIKHDGHDFEIDYPGKDTYRIFKAGVKQTAIVSDTKAAFIERLSEAGSFEAASKYISGVDIIIAEGFKYSELPKIEIHRADVSEKPMENIDNRIAMISDKSWKMQIPVFSTKDFEGVSDFIVDFIKKHKI